jgi:proton glutamate symport protein
MNASFMKKFALHWQILIALVLAVIYGIIFSTRYQVTPGSIYKLEHETGNPDIIAGLKNIENNIYNTKRDLFEALEANISKSQLQEYRTAIIKSAYKNDAVNYISWLGDLFLRALKMLIIPLILSSIVSSITNIGGSSGLGRIGIKTVTYYLSTSIIAIITGLLLVNLFKPGIGADITMARDVEGLAEGAPTLKDTIIQIVPDNIFQSLARGEILPIIFFAILFGYFITMIPGKPRQMLTDLFSAFYEAMMKITLFVIRFTPLGIFGIVAKEIADQDNLVNLMSRMGFYMITVIVGLAIHAFIILPLLLKVVGRINPLKHFKNMSAALLTAFSTSSSGATLPLTMNAVENNSGVSKKISSFTLPLGATINMDGTALYECVAVIFIAQAYGHALTLTDQIIIVITALLASIGAAAIPMAGLVMITICLTAVNLPLQGVGLILAVDRLLDMFRTSVNVWSDSCGAGIIARSEGEKLKV